MSIQKPLKFDHTGRIRVLALSIVPETQVLPFGHPSSGKIVSGNHQSCKQGEHDNSAA